MRLISNLKSSQIILNKIEASKINKVFENKTTYQNVTVFYEIARFYNVPNLSDALFCYIKRFFTVVSETKNFLQLNFAVIAKILSSSTLHITSELEVLLAVNNWLSHNFEERKVFASDLLLKVRLHLIPKNSLEYLLNESSCIIKDDECVNIIKNVLKEESNYRQNHIADCYRHCDEDMFNILICGGRSNDSYLQSVHEIDCKILSKFQTIATHMPESRAYFKAVYLKGNIYFFYGFNKFNSLTSVIKYSMFTKTWECVSDDRVTQQWSTVCGLIDKIYICGGIRRNMLTETWLGDTDRVFDTKNHTWREISMMKHRRESAACSAYQGKMVVSGGYSDGRYLSVVEAYDHTSDEWVEMPSMINAQFSHSQITVKNKLFIISYNRSTCEVFDSECQKFVLINKPKIDYVDHNSPFGAFSVSKKIVVYDSWREVFSYYDIEKDEWSEETFELTKGLGAFACVKVPKLNIF